MAATTSSFAAETESRKNSTKPAPENPGQVLVGWRSAKQQQAYASKLLDALRNIRRTSPPPQLNVCLTTRAVRETADKVLAVAAKGRTRWSRAILSNHRLTGHKKPKDKARPKTTAASPPRRMKRLPAFQSRVRCLARLVPGCRELPLSNLLEETTDYIAALEMQIRAMAELFAGSVAA